MLEEQAPDDIDPTPDETDEGNDDGADEADDARLLQESSPADDQLSDPVDDRDQQEKDLNQARLLIEPFHNFHLRKSSPYCNWIYLSFHTWMNILVKFI